MFAEYADAFRKFLLIITSLLWIHYLILYTSIIVGLGAAMSNYPRYLVDVVMRHIKYTYTKE